MKFEQTVFEMNEYMKRERERESETKCKGENEKS